MPRLFNRPFLRDPDPIVVEALVTKYLSIPFDERVTGNWGCGLDTAAWKLPEHNAYINGCSLGVDHDYILGAGLHVYIDEVPYSIAFVTFHGGNGEYIKGNISWDHYDARTANEWALDEIEEMIEDWFQRGECMDIMYSPPPERPPEPTSWEDVLDWVQGNPMSPGQLHTLSSAILSNVMDQTDRVDTPVTVES